MARPRSIEVHNGESVSWIRLGDEARHGGISTELMRELTEALEGLESSGCPVVGLDVDGARSAEASGMQALEQVDCDTQVAMECFQALRRHPKPIIAAVRGECSGLAIELYSWADLIVVAEGARLANPPILRHVNEGTATEPVGEPAPGFDMWMRLIGERRAREWLFEKDKILDGTTAVRWGWANICAPDAQLAAKVDEMALSIGVQSADALAMKKRFINRDHRSGDSAAELPASNRARRGGKKYVLRGTEGEGRAAIGGPGDGRGILETAFEGRRTDIVRIAANLFEELGYHQCSMEDIAGANSVAKATLYHYFSSKQEILKAIHLEFLDLLTDWHQARLDAGATDVRYLIRELMVDICDLVRTRRGHFRVFIEHRRELAADAQAEITVRRNEYFGIVRGLFERGNDDGILDCNPTLSAMALLGMCNWTYQWFEPNRGSSPRDVAQYFCAILLDGLNSSAVGRLSGEGGRLTVKPEVRSY